VSGTSVVEPAKVVSVSLKPVGRLQDYLAGEIALKRGDSVVVPGEAGLCLGTVEIAPRESADGAALAALKPVVRLARTEDFEAQEENLLRERRAQRLCLEKIREHALKMKLVSVDFALDARRATFYYLAQERIDFRPLVRDLANILNVRIELKQIRARDESKLIGALGPCGRELCCSSWLRDFESVTVKMAREQGLALNPSRLAGMCGRLKCCLRYEYATYLELKRNLPAVNTLVQSVKGDGKVVQQNLLKQTVLIQLDGEGGTAEAGLQELVTERPQ
jgi:cell fate regulator YaaT (PSP1 superfamily)